MYYGDGNNLTNDSTINNTNFLTTIAISITKFCCGLAAIVLFIAILLCLVTTKTLDYSSRMFLIDLYLLNLSNYFLLTFYSPFVAMGFINNQNEIFLLLISTVFNFQARFTHNTFHSSCR